MTVLAAHAHAYVIDRTLICNAILYHFQITLYCGRINRPSSHSHFFSSRAHLSNSSLFVRATLQQKDLSLQRLGHNDLFSHANSNVDIDDISSIQNVFFKSSARDDLLINFLVSRIHPVQEFHITRIQSRQNMSESNIVVIHNHVPQISLTHSSFLRSRPRSSGRHDDVCILATPTSPPSSSSSSSLFERFCES